MIRGLTPESLPFIATYDAENRLKTITVTNSGSLSARIEYRYRWNSFLAQATREQTGQGTNQVRYVRDGYIPTQQRDGSNNLLRAFAWRPDAGGGIGNLIAMQESSLSYAFIYDGKGNVTAVLDDTQGVAAAYRYDGFGRVIARVGTLEQPYLFSTKDYEPISGLTDFGLRFYAAAIGRWTSRDRVGESDGPNLYAYARNNPVSFGDRLGMYCEPLPPPPNPPPNPPPPDPPNPLDQPPPPPATSPPSPLPGIGPDGITIGGVTFGGHLTGGGGIGTATWHF
jgi:RHS repeat-associated protein